VRHAGPMYSGTYMYMSIQRSPQGIYTGGCGLGGGCDHINHIGYHINEIWILKAWGGAAMMKGPGKKYHVHWTMMRSSFTIIAVHSYNREDT
jgi:hypothetical protein